MVSSIRSGVVDAVNQRHGEIISSAFGLMVEKHNDFCGCEYCIKLKEYVTYRKWETKVNRIERDADFYCAAVILDERNRSIEVSRYVKRLKTEKDYLKKRITIHC